MGISNKQKKTPHTMDLNTINQQLDHDPDFLKLAALITRFTKQDKFRLTDKGLVTRNSGLITDPLKAQICMAHTYIKVGYAECIKNVIEGKSLDPFRHQ